MNDATNTLALIAFIAIVVVLATASWILIAKRRTNRLRKRFGPEYTRTVEQQGDPGRAERILERHEKRFGDLHLHPVGEFDKRRFLEAWQADQARFVDNPPSAVMEADRLVTDLMAACGYPIADFEQRAIDIAVSHPAVAGKFRRAHEIALQHQRGLATTEDLRQAMVYYRALFEELLNVPARARVA